MKIIKFSIAVLTFTCLGQLFGQEIDYSSDIWLNADTDDFATIQQNAEEYFADKDKGRGSGYKQWKRWEYMNQHRLTPNGKVTNHAMMNWLAYKEYLGFDGIQKPKPNLDPTDNTNGGWYFLAPTSWVNGESGSGPGIGRINCIAFHPWYPGTIFIGAPSGGMWKTTDDGATWTNLCDGLPAIGVSGIVIHPYNPDIIYILTGDGDMGDTHSIGVLRSNNGGNTWNTTGLSWDITQYALGYKLKMDPTNWSTLFAATNYGLYKTTDAGSSWTVVLNEFLYDIEFKPGDPSTMYATSGNTFFRSTDYGSSWSSIITIPNATRTEIGVTPANPYFVYTVSGPALGISMFAGVLISLNSGQSFSLASISPNILGRSISGDDNKDQAQYDLAIAVSRTDPNEVIVGGINTWRSDNYGVNWEITSHCVDPYNSIGYTHADIHALEINPLNNFLYCASDGGIFKTMDFGDNWIDLSSGLSTTQFYRIASYNSLPNFIIGGTQDNGSNLWLGEGSTMIHMIGGDGMECMIDHNDPSILYISIQYGGLYKSTDMGTTWDFIKPSLDSIWVTPFIMDPVNPLIIYAGYYDIYKTYNGGITWTNLGCDGHTAMAMGTDNTLRIYASHDLTFVKSNNGGYDWYDMSSGLPGHTIYSIAVNPDNSLDVFVTLSGFHNGQKVYRSTNGGETWTNITGSLPNIIVNCIAYEDTDGNPDDAIYIGTDIGVFYRDNNLGDWIPFSNWLPTVIVRDLEVHKEDGTITAATYGRGLWRSQLYSTCVSNWNLFFGTAPQGYSYRQASDYINSTRVYNNGVGQEAYYKAGNEIKLFPGFEVIEGSIFKAWIGPCGSGIPNKSDNSVIEEKDKYIIIED